MSPQERSMKRSAEPSIPYNYKFKISYAMGEKVELKVNGRPVRLKEFPRKALSGTVLGFVKSLDLEEDPREVEIKIRLNEEDNGDP